MVQLVILITCQYTSLFQRSNQIQLIMSGIEYQSSILLSIFTWKGDEGLQTKITNNYNKSDYHEQAALLSVNEEPLICYKQDELNWLLITSDRILSRMDSVDFSLPYSSLVEVTPAMRYEFKNRAQGLRDFTQLSVKDIKGEGHVILCEKGEPYQRIYQLLSHVTYINKTAVEEKFYQRIL